MDSLKVLRPDWSIFKKFLRWTDCHRGPVGTVDWWSGQEFFLDLVRTRHFFSSQKKKVFFDETTVPTGPRSNVNFFCVGRSGPVVRSNFFSWTLSKLEIFFRV